MRHPNPLWLYYVIIAAYLPPLLKLFKDLHRMVDEKYFMPPSGILNIKGSSDSNSDNFVVKVGFRDKDNGDS